jgi:2-oxoglutarate ferredoxin oxidoreductase subunit alpha
MTGLGGPGGVRQEYLRYRLTEDGISPRLIPGKSRDFVTADSDEHDERGRITESAEMRIKMVDKRMRKLEKLKNELLEPEFLGSPSFDTLLVGWGSTYGSIAEAVGLLNEKSEGLYAALVFGDLFPFPSARLIENAVRARQIINIEQNATGQLAGLIREHTGILCTGSILKYDGRQIFADDIVSEILKRGI